MFFEGYHEGSLDIISLMYSMNEWWMHFRQDVTMVCLFIDIKYGIIAVQVGDFMQKKYKLKVVISICETQIKMIFLSASLTA